MKPDIHPKYKKLIIKVGSDEFETMSTYGGDSILMDVDYRKHPAWTKQGLTGASASSHNVANFNKKFGGMSFSAAAKSPIVSTSSDSNVSTSSAPKASTPKKSVKK